MYYCSMVTMFCLKSPSNPPNICVILRIIICWLPFASWDIVWFFIHQVCECNKCHWIVHFRVVKFILRKLYLNKNFKHSFSKRKKYWYILCIDKSWKQAERSQTQKVTYCMTPFTRNTKVVKSIKTERKLLVAGGWEEERMGNDALMGTGLLFRVMKSFCN